MNNIYSQKVELLLKLIPIITDEGVFAVHGGSAINLFLKDLPRYSMDIDLTYIPLEDRKTSIDNINAHLTSISNKARRAFKGMHIVPNSATCKLLCEYRGKQVKIEVNQTKRGIVGGEVMRIPLCNKAQAEFGLYCEADIFRRLCYMEARLPQPFHANILVTYSMLSIWIFLWQRRRRASYSACLAVTAQFMNHLLRHLLISGKRWKINSPE